MKIIYQTNHEGVIGQITEPDEVDASRPYAEQLQVRIGVNDDGATLSADEFEPRARLVVLELRNYLREEFGMGNPPDSAGDDAGNSRAAPSTNGQADAAL